ncbi:MAG: hypothetical protein ABJE63_09650 [Lentilitoribacter sp.]|jgi:hypothetical protein
MKTILAIAAVSVMAISGASAASFAQADSRSSSDNYTHISGDGFVNYWEADKVIKGLTQERFNAADANGDNKLTPTEFNTLG